ncbi:MATE family efflux transporter [Mangrovicoccus algicola]|uniref:MATE family efflux transporter n=1 Tax=Mangrovicoccus algicola TaxID=2771008 RepID=A0A8J6ZB07_9RHOB|nr:MATE family efflux transporter [Mangrovicoccus algicola]MBE3639461.1 MATE family efflux transporter [Mangrovicoccus algicola]
MDETAAAALPLSHGRVWRIAGPMVLSNATVPLVGAVDTAVVGQMGLAAPIGAVAVGAALLNACYWLFGFLRMGTTGMAAQARGAGDRGELVALLSRALLIGAAAGMVLICLQVPLFRLAFGLSTASAEVQEMARSYCAIRIWSAPAMIAGYGIIGWLIANERATAVLIAQLAINGINILLDLWFVLGLGWGVEGVAWATFAAEWAGLAAGLWFCRDAFRGTAWRDAARVFDRARLVAMAAVNADIMIRSVLLLSVGISFVFFFSPAFGEVPLAANQVLMQFIAVTAFALDGLAFAVETLVGQAMGARDPRRLRRAAVMCSQSGLAVGLALTVFFALAGGALIDLMTTAPGVREEARHFLPWMAAVPLLGVAPWMLDGIFIGATRGRDMRNMMLVATGIYFAAALALVPPFGNHGLWAAQCLSYIARGAALAWRYPALERAAARPG